MRVATIAGGSCTMYLPRICMYLVRWARGLLGLTLNSFHMSLLTNALLVHPILKHTIDQCVPPRMHATQLFIPENPHRPSFKHSIHLFQTPVCRLRLETPRRKCREKTYSSKYDVQDPADFIQCGWDVQGEPEVDKPVHCGCHAIRTASRYHWKDFGGNDPSGRCPADGERCDVEV